MKASPRQQQILLKLQEHDTLIARLRRQRTQLPARKNLEGLQAELQSAKHAFMAVQRVSDTQRAEISRLEDDIETVRQRRARDETMLAKSTSSREAQALQSEIDTLETRQAVLEERELEIMESAETTQLEYEQAKSTLEAVDTRRAEFAEQISGGEKAIDAELAAVTKERSGLAAELQRDILDLYEELRTRTGIGAARLRGNVSEASNMTLAPAEMQEIMATAPDDLVFCPGTGVILVRSYDEQ